MSFDSTLFGPFVGASLFLVVKFMAITLIFIYILFALLVIKQVAMMNAVLKTKFAPFLAVMSYAHFLFALLIFVLSFIMLKA